MLYVKNIPVWERSLRIAAGAGMIGLGFLGSLPAPWGLVAGGAGAMLVVTALLGFCPMCAIAGRKLASRR